MIRLWEVKTGTCRQPCKGIRLVTTHSASVPMVASASGGEDAQCGCGACRMNVLQTCKVTVHLQLPAFVAPAKSGWSNPASGSADVHLDCGCPKHLPQNVSRDEPIVCQSALVRMVYASQCSYDAPAALGLAARNLSKLLSGHTIWAAFHPNGQMVASASEDQTMRLGCADGTCCQTLQDTRKSLSSVSA